MKIIGKRVERDNCKVFIAAKVVKIINEKPGKGTLEFKYKFRYKKI